MSLTSTHPSTDAAAPSDPPTDERPRFGIGHVVRGVYNVDESADFYTTIGMRHIVNMGQAAILELRGGTHLIIRKGERSPEPLDLIVDDIDATHAALAAAGAKPSGIERGNPHDRFSATDPSGNVLIINSNHAMGPV